MSSLFCSEIGKQIFFKVFYYAFAKIQYHIIFYVCPILSKNLHYFNAIYNL